MASHRHIPRLVALFAVVSAAAALGACAGGKSINVGDDSSSTATPTPTQSTASVSFASDVYPLFSSLGCSAAGCHGATSPQNNFSLAGDAATVYSSLMTGGTQQTGGTKDVDTTTPANSLILCKNLTGGCDAGHSLHPFATTSDANYVTILNWITAGAQNN